jgi:hypothetical protein
VRSTGNARPGNLVQRGRAERLGTGDRAGNDEVTVRAERRQPARLLAVVALDATARRREEAADVDDGQAQAADSVSS